jgi:type IV pilus assembly protein PilV
MRNLVTTRGFTLIEVLVTLVILMFGLLGIAGLMAKGQRASFEAYQRQQALALANDLAERMRANRAQADAYAVGAPLGTPLGQGIQYNNLITDAITDCGAGLTCVPSALATYDLATWDGLLIGASEQQVAGAANIGGIINARGCVEVLNAPAACPGAPAPPNTFSNITYRVSVAWQGNEDTIAPGAGFTCGTGLYGAETRRRIVTLDVLITARCP